MSGSWGERAFNPMHVRGLVWCGDETSEPTTALAALCGTKFSLTELAQRARHPIWLFGKKCAFVKILVLWLVE